MRRCYQSGVVLLALLVVIAPVAAGDYTPGDFHNFTHASGNVPEDVYQYSVYVPEDYDSCKSYPLVFYLHGGGKGRFHPNQGKRNMVSDRLRDNNRTTDAGYTRHAPGFIDYETLERKLEAAMAEGKLTEEEAKARWAEMVKKARAEKGEAVDFRKIGERLELAVAEGKLTEEEARAKWKAIRNRKPVKVIFETDMCLDVDDVGALATLHALADQNEAHILAVCFNEVHKDGAATIDAINTWYHRGDIPIGIYKKSLPAPDTSRYLSHVARFPNDIPDNQDKVPDALDVYTKALAAQPDGSVTIVSVGFLNNLADLLESKSKLIARKVKQLVIMGGVNNDGFNLVRHGLVATSEKVLRDWPTPIVISQPGGNIRTGQTLESTPAKNPVREAYYRWFEESFKGRSSWDQIAVLYAIRGLRYFSLQSEGAGRLRNGSSIPMKPGWRSFITKKLTNKEYESLINGLMTKPPGEID